MEVKKYFDEKMRDPKFRRICERELERQKIASAIVDYRVKKNLTQKQLGEKFNISQQYISKLEDGDFGSLEKVKPFLEKLGYRLEFKIVPIKKEKTNV